MFYLIIANKFSRNYSEKKINYLKNFFEKNEVKFELIISDTIKQLKNSLKSKIKHNFQEKIIIVIVGGDGTINIVLNILMELPSNNNISIGIIPSGTANILAKEFNIGKNLQSSLEQIISAPEREIKLSQINDKYFIFTCGIGFDGKVVAKVNNSLKNKIGASAYILKGIEVLKRENFPDFNVRLDNISNFTVKSIIVNRIQRYAINRKIFKSAYILSDYFICALFKKIDFSTLIKFFAGIKNENIIFKKAKKIEIISDKNLFAQIDGEPIFIKNSVINLSSRQIKFILPQ